MFPAAYFPRAYFSGAYWPPAGVVVAPPFVPGDWPRYDAFRRARRLAATARVRVVDSLACARRTGDLPGSPP